MSEQSDREIEQAFQMLECCGVPRERAKTVSNGIDVLSTRCQKEANGLAYDIATLKSQRDKLMAEVEEWRAIKAAYLIEYAAMPSHSRPGQYHGHAHDIDGIWDSDNRMFAGCKCAACMMHRAAVANAEARS